MEQTPTAQPVTREEVGDNKSFTQSSSTWGKEKINSVEESLIDCSSLP